MKLLCRLTPLVSPVLVGFAIVLPWLSTASLGARASAFPAVRLVTLPLVHACIRLIEHEWVLDRVASVQGADAALSQVHLCKCSIALGASACSATMQGVLVHPHKADSMLYKVCIHVGMTAAACWQCDLEFSPAPGAAGGLLPAAPAFLPCTKTAS